MTGEARLRQALELTDFVYRITADGHRARAADSQGDAGAHLQTPKPAGS
jgi:hypothetical protein